MVLQNLLRTLILLSCFCGLNQLAQANVLGTMQTFQPTPDLSEFETVHSSRAMPQGRFNIGLFLAYQKNQLTVFENLLTNPQYISYKDSGVVYDLLSAWAITDQLSITLTNTGFLDQSAEDNQIVDGALSDLYITSGSHGLRPGLKYSFRQSPTGWASALIGSVDFPMTNEDPYQGNPSQQIINVEAAFDWFDQIMGYGFNLGYRARNPGEVSNSGKMYPLKSQFTYSAAMVYGLDSDLRYHGELIGVAPLSANDYASKSYEQSVEALLGLRYQLWRDFWWHGGGTIEVLEKGLSPDYRLYAGLNWYFGSRPTSTETKNNHPKAPIAPLEALPLRVSPERLEMYSGSKQSLFISGGEMPYRFETQGFGQFDESTSSYMAPYRSGETEIIVTDAAGGEIRVPVVVLEIPKANKTVDLKSLNFVFSTANLTPKAQKWLEKNLDQLRGIEIKNVVLIGHTDNIGKDSYNQDLSQRRAETVRQSMISYLGLREDQVEAVGAGESQPIATNSTEAGRARNRRVEIRVYFPKE